MTTVLLVEGDDQLRTVLKLTLIYSGYEVSEAAVGREVAAIYEQLHPDLVIVDLLTPVKEGLEVIMDIRRIDRKARILAISRGSQIAAEPYFILAEELGSCHALAKPFTTQELLEALRAVLESKP